MKRSMQCLLAVAGFALCATASAGIKLVNKDPKSHDLTIKCANSTAQSSVGGNSTREIGKGPCTVTVKATGSSVTAAPDSELTIKDGKIK